MTVEEVQLILPRLIGEQVIQDGGRYFNSGYAIISVLKSFRIAGETVILKVANSVVSPPIQGFEPGTEIRVSCKDLRLDPRGNLFLSSVYSGVTIGVEPE